MGSLRRRDADMTEGPIWKQLLAFSVPMAIGLLFQQLYNAVDAIVVGKFVSSEALAAVGSTSSIINMLVGLCAGLSMGASVVISQYYGAHDWEKLQDAVRTTILVTLILCVIATGAGLLLVDPMLRLMDTPAEVLEGAAGYLTIYFSGIGGLLLYNIGSAILRAVGDSRRPLFFLVFSACCNIVFDLLFVLVFRLGIRGVAYATILSQFLSAALVLITLTRTDAPYGIHWTRLGIRTPELKRIFAIGLPAGIQQALTSFSNVFVQSYINYFGAACMAGWAAYNKIDIFILVPVQSIAMASTTFVGQNVGAKNYPRAKEGVRLALTISLIITAAAALAVVLLRGELMTLFTDDAAVLDYGARFLLTISPFYVLICFNQIYAGAMRGVGCARVPMVIMLFSFVFFRQIFLLVNKLFFGNGFFVVSIAYPMGWIVCSLLMFIAYRRSALFRSEPELVVT